MDFDVMKATPNRWVLTDLLGRAAGRIEQLRPGLFRLVPSEQTSDLLREATSHTYQNLGNVIRAVELVSQGACRLKS